MAAIADADGVDDPKLGQARAVGRARAAHDASAAAAVVARAHLLRVRSQRRLPHKVCAAAGAAVGRAIEGHPVGRSVSGGERGARRLQRGEVRAPSVILDHVRR